MQLRHGCRTRNAWLCWLVFAFIAGVLLPAAALLVGAVERSGKSNDLAPARLANTRRINVNPELPESPPAATGKLIVQTYDLAALVQKFRTEVDERESNAQLTIEWFVKRAAPGPWKSKGLVLADPCQVDQLPRGIQKQVKANESARFELGWVNDKLIVVHTAAGHERIEHRLESLKQHGFSQLSIEVRIISGPTIALDKLSGKWELIGTTANGLVGSEPHVELKSSDLKGSGEKSEPKIRGEVESVIHKPLPAILALLDDDEAKLVINAAQDCARTNIISAPKITIFNGESARIEDTTQRPFVVGIRAVQGGGQQPQIQVIAEGTSIRVRPQLLDDDKVLLDLGLTLSDIRSVETVQIPIAGQQLGIGVQIPEVVMNRLRSTVEMRLDQMLAIGLPAADSDKSFQPGCILVKVRKIDESLISEARPGRASRTADEPVLTKTP
jgi:hypothetical protein